VIHALDTVNDVTNDEEEVQHRADLVDQICLTFCHLLSLAEVRDLNDINKVIVENYSMETLEHSLRIVALRITPDKASKMISVKRQLQESWKDHHNHTTDGDNCCEGNCLLNLFSNLENVIL